MALFTINRFHGEEDEEEASKERAQALLQRLHEKAKARQLEKQRASDAGMGTPIPKREDSVDNSTSPSKSEARKTTQTPRSGKKKSKGTGEGEVPKPKNESDLPTGSQTLKASKEEKRKKKKRNSEQEEEADVMKTRDSEHEEEHELGKKVTVKKKRRKSESESRNEEESMKGEKRKRKSTSELINKDGPGDEKGDKSKTSKKSELGDKVGKERKEKGKQKKRNSATELKKEDELGKDVGEQSDEEQSNEDEEKNGSEVLEGEEETTPKSDLETSSLVLGGFQKKAVEKVQRVLPLWLSHPSRVQKDIKQHLVPIHEVPGIHPKLLKKLQANNIHSFFPVQAEVIPAILESAHHGFLIGRGGYRPSDICVSAPTGSGKTLAFVLPVIQALLDRVVCHVRALVVLPTKELAQQVCKVFSIYANGTHLKIVAVTGQKSFVREQETLVEKSFMGFRSMADIVVATPGRLVDHIEQTPGFSLKELRFLIIDEADRMIDSLSQDWLNRVTKAVYRHEDGDDPNSIFARKDPGPITAASTWFPQMPLQKLLFSATLTKNPEKLQQLGLYLPRLFTSVFDKSAGSADTEEDSERSYTLPEGLTHYYVPCNLNSKPLILLHFLVTLKFTRVLCFTNSREASHRLFLLVQAFGGVRTAEFSSRLSTSERQKTLKQFEQGKIQILISTDATARGIDIQGVTCVINYDAPQFMRVYIHRVGRTARAGKSGLAFTLLLNVQKHQFLRMVKDSGTSELQKQFVKSENLKPLLERYEEALVELQRTVADERVKRRA